MRQRLAAALFSLGALLVMLAAAPALWALHAPGQFQADYGLTLVALAAGLRDTANTVSAVMFEFRALDTLGEELMLFAAVTATSVLLRGIRGESEGPDPGSAGAKAANCGQNLSAIRPEGPESAAEAGSALRWWSWPLVALVTLCGASLLLHGHVTPGGGFQGGVLLAAAAGLIYACNDYPSFRRLGSQLQLQRVEAAAIAAMLLAGVPGLWSEGVLLANLLPTGQLGELWSSGLVLALNFFAGVAVGAGFTVIAGDFLEQAVALRPGRWP